LHRLVATHAGDTWAYITACNPASKELTANENNERQAQLRRELEAGGYRIYEGEGIGADPAWTPEPSFLVLGISQEDALALGTRFGQNAIVVGTSAEQAQLVWCDQSRASD
jgi:hypothetical protein